MGKKKQRRQLSVTKLPVHSQDDMRLCSTPGCKNAIWVLPSTHKGPIYCTPCIHSQMSEIENG